MHSVSHSKLNNLIQLSNSNYSIGSSDVIMEAGLSHSVPFRNISLLFLTCYLINRRANELIWWPLVGLGSQQIGSETVDFDG